VVRTLLRWFAAAAALAAGALSASCGPAVPAPDESGETYFGTVTVPRRQVLRYNNGAEPELLDPGLLSGQPDGRIARALFEGLVTPHPQTLEPTPGQAQAWEISADRTTYTFHLRPGLRWTNGDPLTAEDFLYSWRRVLEPTVGSRYASLLYPIAGAEAYNKRESRDPASIGLSAPDAHTFVVRLSHPTPYFLFSVSFYTFLPVHRASVEAHGDRWTRAENIVSNGPFRLAGWRQGHHFHLVKNPSYWDAANVRLEEIYAYSVEELNTSVNLYKSGAIDWNPSGYIPTPYVPHMARYRDFWSVPYHAVYFYSLNTTRPPLDDVWVRRALAAAVDRETIARGVLKGTRLPWGNLTPSGYPGYAAPPGQRFDPAYARECLARAGYPGGQGFPRLEILFNTSEDHRRIAEAVQAMWKEHLNLPVALSNQEWASYLNATTRLEYQVARRSWIGDYPDPSTFLGIFVTGDGNNRTGWSNAEYDRLVRGSEREPDAARRLALLADAERILLDDGVVIPIYHYVLTELVKPYVRGLHPTVLDTHPLKGVWIDTGWRPGDPVVAERTAAAPLP
jgi:oligopeptide transport system substrate-binding protein